MAIFIPEHVWNNKDTYSTANIGDAGIEVMDGYWRNGKIEFRTGGNIMKVSNWEDWFERVMTETTVQSLQYLCVHELQLCR